MSALQQLRELFQPDVEQMVEKRLEERLPSIIQALYPSILQHVANNLHLVNQGNASNAQITKFNNGGILKPESATYSLQLNVGPGQTQFIGSPIHGIDPNKYSERMNCLYDRIDEEHHMFDAAYKTLNTRLFNLEQKVHESTPPETAS